MPEYLAPGVYVEEISSGARPIEGVGTSTAGFVGPAARGPIRLTLVSSWGEFVRRYGGFIDTALPAATGHYLPYAVRGFFENGGARLVVARVTGEGAATASWTSAAAPGSLTIDATGPGAWGNDVHVTIEASALGPGRFTLRIDHAELRETFSDLSTDPTHAAFAVPLVNRGSELVEIRTCPAETPPPMTRQPLRGGTDAAASLHDYLGRPMNDALSGLAALSAIHEISIMSAPDDVVIEGLAAAVLERCESGRDRFAVTAEPHPERQPAEIRPIRQSSWGATYHPWLRVPGDHLPTGIQVVPPHGHICGIYARVDAMRGVHRPPANEEVRGIVGLSHAVTQAQQEALHPRGVNIIRDFRPQRGVLLWGARTMAAEADWKYINVRRLCIFIERSIERGLQWVVFEPSMETTWLEVRRVIEVFLVKLWRDGALLGGRVEEAFFVRCDRGTMTDADLAAGRLVCEVGIAPIRPAEFVILRIVVRTAVDDGS
jgi:phage tail sheath protein FI